MTHLIPIGIDVGKSGFHLSIADGSNPRKYPVHEIKYQNPMWRNELKHHITHTPLLTIEPTGINYSTPIIHAILDAFPDVQVFWVNHNVVANARSLYLSRAKSDNLDAQALAWLADQIALGNQPRGIYPFIVDEEDQRLTLRELMNQRISLERQSTRHKNKLDAMLHRIAPELPSIKEQLVRNNIPPIIPISDEIIKSLHHKTHKSIIEKIRHIPPVQPSPRNLQVIEYHYNQINQAQDEIEYIDTLITRTLDTDPLAPIVQNLRTMPAMYDVLIACLLIPANPTAISVNEYKRAVGVAPLTNKSGAKDTTSWKNRAGYRPAMKLLHLYTMQVAKIKAKKNIPEIVKYQQNHSHSACKRKVVSIIWGVANSGTPYQPKR